MNIARIVANKFGYELERPKICELTLCSHLSKVIQHYAIDLVIDVGANKGQFAQLLRKNGYQGIIYSIEPGSQAFAKLSGVCEKDPNWHCYKCALGSKSKSITLSISNLDYMSSLYEFNEYGKQFGGEYSDIVRTERVEMKTLDEFIYNKSIPVDIHTCLLKIDTQGHDLQILKGAQDVLSEFKMIQTEIALKPIYDEVPSYEEVLKFCKYAGFSITGMYPVNRDKSSLELIEMDCVMVKP